MRSFLGVPIVAPQGVIGAFYLTEKTGAPDFTDEDEELIELLAAHAAIAIANARLYEQTRELSIVAERNRLALDLHDAVSQKLFGLVLSAETAQMLLERDPAAAREQVAKLQTLAQEARDELRSLVFELRPPDLEHDGLGGALAKHVELLRRLQQREIELDVDGELAPNAPRDGDVLRIAQEALQNALRHADAEHVAIRLSGDNGSSAARGRGRRRRIRSRRGGAPVAAARPDVDGGARATTRRKARHPLGGRRGNDGEARGRLWLSRSASWSSTTTRSFARGCAPSSSSRTASQSPARRPTARTQSSRPSVWRRTSS